MAGILESSRANVRRRRVFFSFHYQNDIWRVNQVRNSWRYQHGEEREAEGFFDASIWESSKRTGPDSLKHLIREGMKNTSVTCVLSGSETYRRRWVRYEIARSILKGNGLLVVSVHRLKNQAGLVSNAGENPLDCMGSYRANDGRLLFAELRDGRWIRYSDYAQAVTLPGSWWKPTSNVVVPFSQYAREYCYVLDNGSKHFSSWVRQAAE